MTKIVFGLDNPGRQYNNTRHNLGGMVVSNWLSLTRDMEFPVKVIHPENNEYYMNESGITLMNELKNENYEPEDILVAHDDIELPIGAVELVLGGSAKGHNGVRSIYNALGTQNIHRLRLGVGRPPEGIEVKDFVLSKFTATEQLILEKVPKKANQLIDEFIET